MKKRSFKMKDKKGGSFQHKGSLTVESAFVLPFFFLAVVMLAGILDLFRIGMLVQTSLCESAKELGMYAYCISGEEESPVGKVDQAICIAYGTQKVQERFQGERASGILGNIQGITLLGSEYKEGKVMLKASFFYKSPVALFPVFPVKIEVQGQARAWIGYQGEQLQQDEDETMVYVAEWESVYHKNKDCTHLKLTVSNVPLHTAEEERNIYGERYLPCERCGEAIQAGQTVYISRTGTRYHSDAGCGGLTRHIKEVKKSEVEHLKACERCKGE